MKSIWLFWPILAVVIVGCQSNSAAPNAASDGKSASRPSDMDSSGKAVDLTATLHVKGMSCPLCANNIDKQLLRVPGVTGVTVDLGTGQVRARLVPDNPPGRQALARAIEQSGFTLERIEMPPGLEDRP